MKLITWFKFYILRKPMVVQYEEEDFRVAKFEFSGTIFCDKQDKFWWHDEQSVIKWSVMTSKEQAQERLNQVTQKKFKKVIYDT